MGFRTARTISAICSPLASQVATALAAEPALATARHRLGSRQDEGNSLSPFSPIFCRTSAARTGATATDVRHGVAVAFTGRDYLSRCPTKRDVVGILGRHPLRIITYLYVDRQRHIVHRNRVINLLLRATSHVAHEVVSAGTPGMARGRPTLGGRRAPRTGAPLPSRSNGNAQRIAVTVGSRKPEPHLLPFEVDAEEALDEVGWG